MWPVSAHKSIMSRVTFMKLLLSLANVPTRLVLRWRMIFQRNCRSLPHTTITWKKSLKIESRSKSHVITKSFRNRHWSLLRNMKKARFISVILLKKKRNYSDFSFGAVQKVFTAGYTDRSILKHESFRVETVSIWVICGTFWCTSHYISPVMLNAVRNLITIHFVFSGFSLRLEWRVVWLKLKRLWYNAFNLFIYLLLPFWLLFACVVL